MVRAGLNHLLSPHRPLSKTENMLQALPVVTDIAVKVASKIKKKIKKKTKKKKKKKKTKKKPKKKRIQQNLKIEHLRPKH